MEMERALTVKDTEFEEETLTVTHVILIGTGGTVQRLLQDPVSGKIYAINNVFVAIVDNGQIEKDQGEYAVEEPFFHPLDGVLWKNNVCKLRAGFRTDEKNRKVLENLKGVDLMPEMPA